MAYDGAKAERNDQSTGRHRHGQLRPQREPRPPPGRAGVQAKAFENARLEADRGLGRWSEMEQLVSSLGQLVDLSRAARTGLHMRHCCDALHTCQRAKSERHEVFVDGCALGAEVVAHLSGQGSAPPPARS